MFHLITWEKQNVGVSDEFLAQMKKLKRGNLD